ncbi:OPT/YSL family transporter, partial [Veillonella atypica]
MASFIGTTIGMAGNFMSELKVAHMTGATPKNMEQWQIVGTILCAVLSVGVMILLNGAYGFVGDHALNAPQANAIYSINRYFVESVAHDMPSNLCVSYKCKCQ